MVGEPTGRYAVGMKLIAFAAALLALSARGQVTPEEMARGIGDRAVRVASIDPTIEGDDFADLMPLKDAIGEARVVWLGEQSHGEGAAFMAKGRLIKFLHQEMGFDVLVWEAGLASGPLVDEAMRDPEMTAIQAAERSVFPIWSETAQVRPTLEYVKESHATDRPITSAGMDAQLTGMKNDRALERLVVQLFEPTGEMPELVDAIEPRVQAFWRTQSEEDGEALLDVLQQTLDLLDVERERLEQHHEPWRVGFAQRAIGDAMSFVRVRMAVQQAGGRAMDVGMDLLNERDDRMGDNIVFLAEEVYPDRKLIVWAATFHGIYDLAAITFPAQPGMYDTMHAAGMTAHRMLGDDLYHIAFVAEGGEVRNVFGNGQGRLPPRPKGSFEDALTRIEHPFLFMDLRGLPHDHWMYEPTVMAPLGNAPMTAIWPDQFDAVFSIETEFPASRDAMHPEGAVVRVEP